MCMKLLRRFGASVAALVLCFALSIPCFAAANDSPDVAASLRSQVYGYLSSAPNNPVDHSTLFVSSVDAPFYGSNQPFSSYDGLSSSAEAAIWAIQDFRLNSSDWFSGAVGLYVSMYCTAPGVSSPVWENNSVSYLNSNFELFYIDHVGASHSGSISASTFIPVIGGSSQGVTFKASVVVDQAEPISSIGFRSKYSYPLGFSRLSNGRVLSLYIPSATVVVASNSDELAALENMADSIAQQNQIMSQFYGQIIQVCNQIYNRLGDIQAAQEEANALFSQVINLLNTTNGKLSAINQAMSAYFDVLIAQLKQEGIDTRTAIADAEARLEAYLKPMIDYFNKLEETTGESASSLPQHKTDLDKFGSDDGYGISDDGQSGLMAIMPVFSAFSFVFSILAFFIGLGVLGIIIRRGMS